jgi:hypothetical protein
MWNAKRMSRIPAPYFQQDDWDALLARGYPAGHVNERASRLWPIVGNVRAMRL